MNALMPPATELAPWVPTTTPPLRTGVFQMHDAGSQSEPWFSFWDGRWHGAWTSPDEALDRRDFPTPGSVAKEWTWRGFVSNPLADAA